MELLKIEGLTKVIKKKKILDNISLQVNSGEIVGFLGPNGAGKTTTIKLILGLFNTTQGKISVCGYDIKTDFEKAMANVGGIVENPDLYKRLTGRQNLEYFASMHDDVNKESIEGVIKLVKMAGRIDDKVKNYSLGMCQRIGIAQALLHNPQLLVLDEPTNGLDPLGIKELRDLLKMLAKEVGIGVFVSSHLLSEIELMCDRVYVIDNGVIIGERRINQDAKVEEEAVYQYTFVTDNNDFIIEYFKTLQVNYMLENGGVSVIMKRSDIPGIVRHLVNNNVSVYAIDEKHRTLEQEFISMTTGSKAQIR